MKWWRDVDETKRSPHCTLAGNVGAWPTADRLCRPWAWDRQTALVDEFQVQAAANIPAARRSIKA